MYFYFRIRKYSIWAKLKNNIRFICLQTNFANTIRFKIVRSTETFFTEIPELNELPHMAIIIAAKEEMIRTLAKFIKITNAVIQRETTVSHSSGERKYTCSSS